MLQNFNLFRWSAGQLRNLDLGMLVEAQFLAIDRRASGDRLLRFKEQQWYVKRLVKALSNLWHFGRTTNKQQLINAVIPTRFGLAHNHFCKEQRAIKQAIGQFFELRSRQRHFDLAASMHHNDLCLLSDGERPLCALSLMPEILQR